MTIELLSVLTLTLTPILSTVKSIDVEPHLPPVEAKTWGTWYGEFNYHGTHMANGDKFYPTKEVTCAHRSAPFGSYLHLTDPETGKSIWCRVTDRGPYIAETPDGRMVIRRKLKKGEYFHRDVDISIKAARKLGVYDKGLFKVTIRRYRDRCSTRHRIEVDNESRRHFGYSRTPQTNRRTGG